MSDAYTDPVSAALAGDGCGPNTKVLALSYASDAVAGVLLSDPSWPPEPEFVWCERETDGSWREAGTASGRTLWRSSDDGGVGVLVCWGTLDRSDATGLAHVAIAGSEVLVRVDDGFGLAMFDAVPRSAADEEMTVELLQVEASLVVRHVFKRRQRTDIELLATLNSGRVLSGSIVHWGQGRRIRSGLCDGVGLVREVPAGPAPTVHLSIRHGGLDNEFYAGQLLAVTAEQLLRAQADEN